MGIQLEQIEKLHLALIGMTAGLAWLTGWMGAGSVVLGGAVMAANVWLLKQIARRLLTAAAARRPGVVLLLVLAKFSIFLALLGLLFWRVPLDPMAFAAGATLLTIASVSVALAAPNGAATVPHQAEGQG